jgi:hypothetical protein
MNHPLKGCYARINRSKRYIDETKQLLINVARECEEQLVVNPDNTLFFDHVPEIPADLPLAISDAVHNMRAALDYLVYQLAKLDSGAFQDDTQFPIADDKNSFDDSARKRLKWLDRHHVDRIELLQPYNDIKWTRNLRDISNRDKHRDLTPITRERANIIFTGPDTTGHGRRLPNGVVLRAQPMYAVQMVLPSGDASIESTLWSMLGSVVDTVNSFNPDFV